MAVNNSDIIEDSNSLPQLTDKQYKFVQGKAKGLSNAEAYRQAYGDENKKPETVWRRAAELSSNGKVKAWLAHLKQEAISELLDQTGYTLQVHISELDDLKQMAIERGQMGPAIQSVVSKGKAVGHYVDHKIVEHREQDIGILEEIRRTLGEIAYQEAVKRLGYDNEHAGSPGEGAGEAGEDDGSSGRVEKTKEA